MVAANQDKNRTWTGFAVVPFVLYLEKNGQFF
jgi:hypothetical protein